MTLDIVLFLSGMIAGLATYGVVAHLQDRSAFLEIENELIDSMACDLNQLYSEIEQFGYETYRREGKIQMRKKAVRRGRPKKNNTL